MEIETAVTSHGERRRFIVTGQGSGNVRFHSLDDGSANCFIARIPEAVLSEIFLKLDDVRSLIRCRRVCKSWRGIIFSQTFARSFQATRPEPIVICRSGKLFYFIQAQELSIAAISSYRHKGSNLTRTSPPPVMHLVNSCNGLLCMTICSGRIGNQCSLIKGRCHGETIFIVNPVTNEFIALPSCGQGMRMDVCGLGFCAQTNEFKVLRILSKKPYKARSRVVQVYTIGSTKWRSVAVNLESLDRVFPRFYQINMLTCFNGYLYWINDRDAYNDIGILLAFDFAKEQFQQTSEQVLDDLFELGHITDLRAFNSLFCYVRVGKILGKLFLFNKDRGCKGQQSNKVRVIQWCENGTILLRKDDYFYSFVKETRMLKKYSECMITSDEDVVGHVPCFLSLKDVVKGQSSLVQKLGSGRGQRNELDVVVQKAKSLAELQDDAVLI